MLTSTDRFDKVNSSFIPASFFRLKFPPYKNRPSCHPREACPSPRFRGDRLRLGARNQTCPHENEEPEKIYLAFVWGIDPRFRGYDAMEVAFSSSEHLSNPDLTLLKNLFPIHIPHIPVFFKAEICRICMDAFISKKTHNKGD